MKNKKALNILLSLYFQNVFKVIYMKSMKGQSAMEYLMTYGWAILIIAIVLVALFELGIFGGSTLPTACVAQSGFICSNPSFVGANIIVTVGQSSGQNYGSTTLAFINSTNLHLVQGTSPSFPSGTSVVLTSMTSGSTYTENVPIGYAAPTAGTGISGELWISYTLSGTTQYQELATITAKETS